MALPIGSITAVGYTAVFATAAIACFVSLYRARRIDDTGTRRGLVALLVTCGSWAATQVGFVAAPTERFAAGVYLIGLLLGFATVFAWLYFASAYTGRSYHREPIYRRLGLGLYGLVAAVKLTNPIHHRYFTTAFVAEPFPHIVVQQGNLHWIATGLSYVLAGIGIFILLERFAEADYDTRVLALLVGLTGLPVVFSVVGYVSPRLLDFSYAPLGVAAVVFLDAAERIRDHNRAARDLFPELVGAVGDPIDSLAPIDSVPGSEEVLERTDGGETRYYLVDDRMVGPEAADIRHVLAFTDVTAIERQRRELERHNDQLEGFAVGVRHELRNALTVVGGYTDWASEALDDGDVADAREALDTVSGATDRMSTTVDDLATLAQYGRTTEGTEPIDFRETVTAAWAATGTSGLELAIEGEGTIEANGPRLRKLFENALEFYTHNGGSKLTVSLREDGFAISDDGQPPPPDAAERCFDYGDAAPATSAGMALPNVRTLARVHGWSATIDPEYADGLRIVVAG
ncbi:histidine kinase, partial [Halobacteriales archaeon QH_6_64_20]